MDKTNTLTSIASKEVGNNPSVAAYFMSAIGDKNKSSQNKIAFKFMAQSICLDNDHFHEKDEDSDTSDEIKNYYKEQEKKFKIT